MERPVSTRRRRVRERVKQHKERRKWRVACGMFLPKGEAKVARFVYPNGPSIRSMMERGKWYRVSYTSYDPPINEDGLNFRQTYGTFRMEKL